MSAVDNEPVQVAESPAAGETFASATSRIFLIFLASGIELIAAGRVCDKRDKCEDEFGFAVAVGAVSLAVSLLFMLVVYLSPASVGNAVTQIVALFMLMWWAAGAGVNTFRDPFVATGNGYFSSWLAFFESVRFSYQHVPFLRSLMDSVKAKGGSLDRDNAVVVFLCVTSIIELTAAASLCDKRDKCEDEEAFAVAAGAISTVLTILAFFVSSSLPALRLPTALVLAALWVFGVGVLTFDEPWTVTGNGYFSTWLAFFAAMYWLYMEVAVRFPRAGGGGGSASV